MRSARPCKNQNRVNNDGDDCRDGDSDVLVPSMAVAISVLPAVRLLTSSVSKAVMLDKMLSAMDANPVFVSSPALSVVEVSRLRPDATESLSFSSSAKLPMSRSFPSSIDPIRLSPVLLSSDCRLTRPLKMLPDTSVVMFFRMKLRSPLFPSILAAMASRLSPLTPR